MAREYQKDINKKTEKEDSYHNQCCLVIFNTFLPVTCFII